MMEVRKVMLLLLIMVEILAFTVPVTSQQGDDISVSGADAVTKTATGMASGLSERLATVGARVAAQYSDALRWIGLGPVSTALQTLLDQVPSMVTVQYADADQWKMLPALPSALQNRLAQISARVTVQYADADQWRTFPALPSGLQTRLAQVSPRVIFHYADASRSGALTYPTALFNDTTAPQMTNIAAAPMGGGNVKITWATNEFATSAVLYGTQSGVYPHTVSSPLYTKQHEITLTGLTTGTRYYYRVRSTDRSGNTATSTERSFVVQIPVYLPLVLRGYR